MNIQELEALVKSLQTEVRSLRDAESIRKLQLSYGYYIENWMTDEIVDLFSDSPNATLIVHTGEFHGKEAIKRFFKPRDPKTGRRKHEFFHQVMQLSPIVDVAPDGLTAKGRFYGFGAVAAPVKDKVFQGWMNGVYENEYIKENGVWKIMKLHWWMYFFAPYSIGWVEKDRQTDPDFHHSPPESHPDFPPEDTYYPSEYICPFHFNHPVTGQPTPVEEQKR